MLRIRYLPFHRHIVLRKHIATICSDQPLHNNLPMAHQILLPPFNRLQDLRNFHSSRIRCSGDSSSTALFFHLLASWYFSVISSLLFEYPSGSSIGSHSDCTKPTDKTSVIVVHFLDCKVSIVPFYYMLFATNYRDC